MSRLVISLIHFYRWAVSPFLSPSCRFEPTCSRYAITSIEFHGLAKGTWMTLKRLARCHPYEKFAEKIGASWGYDPVPAPKPANIPSSTTRRRTAVRSTVQSKI